MADPGHDPETGRRPGGRPRPHGGQPGHPSRGRPATANITDARSATSEELSTRVRRYSITMAFRLACFVSMIWVTGWLRWVLLAGAVVLPYIAVVLANQSDQRGRSRDVEAGAPEDAPQLVAGEHVEVIDGDVEEQPEGRVA